jgi:hypothetical protein
MVLSRREMVAGLGALATFPPLPLRHLETRPRNRWPFPPA